MVCHNEQHLCCKPGGVIGISQHNYDLNEKTSEEKHELLNKEKKFLKIVNKSVSLIDGHYTLNLSFREDDMLPCNVLEVQEKV